MKIIQYIKRITHEFLWYTVIFFISIVLFLAVRFALWGVSKVMPSRRGYCLEKIKGVDRFLARINQHNFNTIGRVGLMELAVRNMLFNKSRSFITVGGMAVGIGAIVFLVSIGYGVQNLVIDRVAGLDEMKQADIMPQVGTKIKINDKTIADISALSDISGVFPLISVVGNVQYKDSISDIVAYGVTSGYLEESAIAPIRGKLFESTALTTSEEPKVALSAGDRESLENSEGETKKSYESIESGSQTSADGIDWVNLEGEDIATKESDIQYMDFSEEALKEAVLNRSAVAVLGLSDAEAVGQKFTVSFSVVGDIFEGSMGKVISVPTEYTIRGVTPDEGAPQMYVPFVDIRSLGVVSYSQVKVAVHDEKNLERVRRQIESMGYTSSSVVDTVNQINSLFATARIILGLLGMVALAVASLGMFNTLTVSLLERTREVGLMKAMGMRSDEVRELFLTESMVMGSVGGILGISLGYIGGKFFGLILSIFSLSQGEGFLDVTFIPLMFILFILGLSLVVGIVTGIYPARRSAHISALNALRYE